MDAKKRFKTKEGAYSYFLNVVSSYLDDDNEIPRVYLPEIKKMVNERYEVNPDAFDVTLTWSRIKSDWDPWNQALKFVNPKDVDWNEGAIKPTSPRSWNALLEKVPETSFFQESKLTLANQVHSILNRSSNLHSSSEDLNLSSTQSQTSGSKKINFQEAGSSSWPKDEKEIKASMRVARKIDGLKSLGLVNFCTTLFQDKEHRRRFSYLPNNYLKVEYVKKEYNKLRT